MQSYDTVIYNSNIHHHLLCKFICEMLFYTDMRLNILRSFNVFETCNYRASYDIPCISVSELDIVNIRLKYIAIFQWFREV